MDLVKELLRSKKFIALLVGVFATAATHILVNHIGMDPAEAKVLATEISTKVSGLVGAYIVSQGIADFGKEKAKVVAVMGAVKTD